MPRLIQIKRTPASCSMSRVCLAIGEAMETAGVTPQALRAAVLALRGDRR